MKIRLLQPQFSLRTLICATAVVALVLASLLRPWQSWTPALVLTGILTLMLLALPVAIYALDRQRAFYVGFACTGWGYFVLAWAPWCDATIGRQLLAQPIAESICFATTDSLADMPQILSVTQALFMLAVAWCGGQTASLCYVRSRSAAKVCEPLHVPRPVPNQIHPIDSTNHF